MKLKNSMLMMLIVSLTLILAVSVAFANDIETNGISLDDTVIIEESVDDTQDVLSAGNVIYISPSGNGSGSSESDPANWNSALSNANSGDTIQFLNGNYTEINNVNQQITKSLTLKGSGNSIIDAQENGGFFTVASGANVVLQNLTLQKAYTGKHYNGPDGSVAPFNGEGGIINNGELTAIDCYFYYNKGFGTEGGSIRNNHICNIYNSTFDSNSGAKGASIYCEKNSKLNIYNSDFQKGFSKKGNAIYADENAVVTIHNSTLGNAYGKSGLIVIKKSYLYMYDTNITGARSIDTAGVVNVDKKSTVEIYRCIFEKNSATGGVLLFNEKNETGDGDGGAIVIEKGANNVIIKDSIFRQNNAKNRGGAIYIESDASITIDNCTFENNTAGYGRNIYCYAASSSVSVKNSLLDVISEIKTSDIAAGEIENIQVSLDEGTNGVVNPEVSLILNGEKTSYKAAKSGSVSLPGLKEGKYTVELSSDDDKNTNRYVYTQKSSSFKVGEVKENETAEPVKNESNTTQPVKNETVSNTTEPVKNETNTTQPVKNETVIPGSDVNETAVLGSQFNVTEAQSIETYAVDFPAGEKGKVFQFQLTDSEGKAIADAPVQFAYKSVILNRTTNKNGIVSLGVSTQFADSYLCALSYLGDDTHNASFVAFNFKLAKKPITITAKAKTFKKSLKTKKYTVTLKTKKCASRDGKVYLKSGKKVTLKVNGKTYTAKINAKGKATFKITKLAKKGKFTALIKFAGDKTYNAASKKVKITVR